ncbi:MAG: Thioredoxin-disulfide reductase [Lachnospiraceae bacterium]|jgi:thioredoxin reductase (NADPH)|nr:Thioredoxin-disulfide reductase [Lachnospiraceae bacterium]
MANIIIIGNGPAGVSTALYTTRAGFNTTIIGKDSGALGKAKEIENYYGFEAPISGQSLIEGGISQAKRLGVEFISDEVVGLNYNGKLVVQTKNQDYVADSVVIATGTSRMAPKIKGLKEYEGYGVSYCAVCDAFFYRGKDVAVLGEGEYAVHEAMELLPTSKSVTILTNGKEPLVTIPSGIRVNTAPVTALEGTQVIDKVIFKDGTSLAVAGVFVALGVAGSSALAKKIGAQIDGNKIVVDENMATSIPGLYAAGDCTGGLLQIAKAVYEGAKAGTEVIKYLRNNEEEKSA